MIDQLPSRIRAKIAVTDDGHWLWVGASSGGSATAGRYGHVWDSTAHKTRRAHVVVYELLVGPVPEGMVLDHECRIRLCVNPDCLTPRTHAENVKLGMAGKVNNWNVPKTHCPQGHPYSGSNLYEAHGRRFCRACRSAAAARHRLKKARGR